MRASVRLVDCASSSLVYTSGYCVRAKARSSASSCSAVKVVRDRRCLRFNGMPGSDSVSLMSESRPVNEMRCGGVTTLALLKGNQQLETPRKKS